MIRAVFLRIVTVLTNNAARRSVKWRGLEADIVVNLLKQARIEVSKADVQSKKLLDALIKVVIDEFYTLAEEKDSTNCFVSMKGLVVCLCVLIWSFAVSMFLLFDLRLGSSGGGPLPT
ncbi:hypothetical protein OIU76_013640 [Salix suchowensis]|nr:hypothetical protein OIU76_013640 [Salix suchowensis]KAJ6318135.1 hypothetical protein OIU76_013640 [Salix suchowensis]KAJ6318136.1 hypothetical protein OIU76_013640 [Salix suchowensis]